MLDLKEQYLIIEYQKEKNNFFLRGAIFNIHNVMRYQKTFCVVKIIEQKDNFDFDFFELIDSKLEQTCSLMMQYVIINKANFIFNANDKFNGTAYFDVTVFDPNSNSKIKKVVSISNNTIYICFYQLIRIVNAINFYLSSSKTIDEIDWNYCLDYKNKLAIEELPSIIEPIKKLEIEFLNYCEYRTGRDNYFYTRCKVNMLPNNRYLRKLIIQALSKSSRIVTITDTSIELSYNGDYAHYPSLKEEKIEEQDSASLNTKFNLLVNVAKEYNPIDELLFNMSLRKNEKSF